MGLNKTTKTVRELQNEWIASAFVYRDAKEAAIEPNRAVAAAARARDLAFEAWYAVRHKDPTA